ncbi:hypothetical protein H6G80_33480 [Nostoc sp. FACHB-87]|uniref:hypothetical protein n=1 Tax=Nostocaceae TaxID=1162 RepID=UPI0016850F7D|nr:MULTISPECIES: hypothetical protein [Nostocaceae]MBD2458950.1 hypothetical protein [Nostoc sp. FACHB-87]MBD2479960.1 hypothetical protein [Anabaena sp. FACHB-83]
MPRAATAPKRKPRAKPTPKNSLPTWADDTELVGLVFDLEATATASLYSQYTIGLHAWFLDQVRQVHPDLSAYLHDGESEKAFSISALEGQLFPSGKQLKLVANQIYHWHINALSQRVALFLKQWLINLPKIIDLRGASLNSATAEQLITDMLAQRIEELTEIFTEQRKRRGGDRTDRIAVTWATVLARREHGDSLAAIALDLEMKPETVKTYVKLARKALKGTDENP